MKTRLDRLLVEKGLAESRVKAQDLIAGGKVTLNQKVLTKASQKVANDSEVQVQQNEVYVGRGAYKLKHAHEVFHFPIEDKVCGDIGASTGGFTDYLLQKGAKKVYAVDVGHDQLTQKLCEDKRVVNLERTHILELPSLPEKLHLIVVDLSFISLKKVLVNLFDRLATEGILIALFKPQFEAGSKSLLKKGILPLEYHQNVIIEFENWCLGQKIKINQKITCELKGRDGNQEYLFQLTRK